MAYDNKSISSEYTGDQGVFLLGLYRVGIGLPERELYRYFLDYAVKLTDSTIGFFHLLDADQKAIKLTAWNQEVLRNCIIPNETHYPIERAGNWMDCVRLKKPTIYNDYAVSPNQKGLPKGHVEIHRMLNIPIIEGDEVFAIFGVGNKETDYENKDLQKLELVATELNKILKQRRIEAQLRQAKEQYQALFQNMNEGFAFCKVLYDENGVPEDFVYLETNKAFEQITKLTSVAGKKVSETGRRIKEDPELLCIYNRVAQSGKVEKHEVYSRSLGLWLSISVYSPLKGFFAAVLEDITSRKGAEQELEEHNKQLEKLVEARTRQLHEQERLAAIGSTAGMVGHDIRNPLQAMIGDVYLLKDALDVLPEGAVKEQVTESLGGLEENILYVNKIVSDLQDFARPIQPKFSIVDLCQLVEDVVEPFSFPENIHSEVLVDDPLELITDQSLLKRVFENLIINAVQAMPDGGKLQVTGTRRQQKVCIIVQDTGVGIPIEVKPKLFIPMFTTKSKGQGFGLAVVKRIVTALNGTVDCESQEGIGTRFLVTLPVNGPN